jgi:hypothetical protein
MALQMGRLFPMLKLALGYARAVHGLIESGGIPDFGRI